MEIEIIKFLQANANIYYDIIFKFFSYLGSYMGVIIIFLALFFINKKYSLFYLGTYGFGIGLNTILKMIINRPRPFEVDSEIINWLPTIGESMPSGHMLTITIGVTFILYLMWKSKNKKSTKILTTILFSLICICVGISRMYLGQHYISDLLVGFILAILVGLSGILLYINSGKIYEYFRDNREKRKQKKIDTKRD